MALTVKKEQERSICRGGNSPLLYLPKEYFTPGEKVGSLLEIDPDGNLKMVLTKKLFNFTCEGVKALAGADFAVEYDKTVAGTQIFSAVKGNIALSCTKLTRDIEPAYVTVSRRFTQVHSANEYANLTGAVKKLISKKLDAYIEPEGDLDMLNIFKNPQRYNLKDEAEAVAALQQTGKKLDFSLIIRFNSKNNTLDEIKQALAEINS